MGGTLYLGHFVNEATSGNFDGIHQWDIDCRDSDAVMVRGKYLFNLTKYASSFCDVTTVLEKGERWIGNDQTIPADRVVSLIKKKAPSPKIVSETPQIYDRIITRILIYENSAVYRNIGFESARIKALFENLLSKANIGVLAARLLRSASWRVRAPMRWARRLL